MTLTKEEIGCRTTARERNVDARTRKSIARDDNDEGRRLGKSINTRRRSTGVES